MASTSVQLRTSLQQCSKLKDTGRGSDSVIQHTIELNKEPGGLAASRFLLIYFLRPIIRIMLVRALPQKGLNTTFCLKKQVDRSSRRDSRPT